MEPPCSNAASKLDNFAWKLKRGLRPYVEKTLTEEMALDILTVWQCIGRYWSDTWKKYFRDIDSSGSSRTQEEWLEVRKEFIRKHYNEYYMGLPMDGTSWNSEELYVNYMRCQNRFGGILLNKDKDRMVVIEPNKRIQGENYKCEDRVRSGDWTFPKGHRQVYRYYKHENAETSDNAAIREIHEETGINECLLRTYINEQNFIKFTPFLDETVLFIIHFHDLTDDQLPEPGGWDKLEVYRAHWIDTNHVLRKLKDQKEGGYHWEIRTGVMRRLMARCLQNEVFLNQLLVHYPETYIFRRGEIPDMPSKFQSGFESLYGSSSDYKNTLPTNRQPWQVEDKDASASNMQMTSHWTARGPVSHKFRHKKPTPCCALIDDDDSLYDVMIPLLTVESELACGRARESTTSGGALRTDIIETPAAEPATCTKSTSIATISLIDEQRDCLIDEQRDCLIDVQRDSLECTATTSFDSKLEWSSEKEEAPKPCKAHSDGEEDQAPKPCKAHSDGEVNPRQTVASGHIPPCDVLVKKNESHPIGSSRERMLDRMHG